MSIPAPPPHTHTGAYMSLPFPSHLEHTLLTSAGRGPQQVGPSRVEGQLSWGQQEGADSLALPEDWMRGDAF
eukprot:1158376-Pelagomonas_calceolata.AAC.8